MGRTNYQPIKCKICGEIFKPKAITQVCCSDACTIVNKRLHTAEANARRPKGSEIKLETTSSVKKRTIAEKKKWADIVKICEKHGLSYGEAASRGII